MRDNYTVVYRQKSGPPQEIYGFHYKLDAIRVARALFDAGKRSVVFTNSTELKTYVLPRIPHPKELWRTRPRSALLSYSLSTTCMGCGKERGKLRCQHCGAFHSNL